MIIVLRVLLSTFIVAVLLVLGGIGLYYLRAGWDAPLTLNGVLPVLDQPHTPIDFFVIGGIITIVMIAIVYETLTAKSGNRAD